MREGAAVGFLNDILRLVVIPNHATRDAVKAAVVALHDQAHRGGIILYGVGDQLRFVRTTLRLWPCPRHRHTRIAPDHSYRVRWQKPIKVPTLIIPGTFHRSHHQWWQAALFTPERVSEPSANRAVAIPMEALMSKSALTFSRRQSLKGLALVGAGASFGAPAFTHRVAAAAEKSEKSLYERLGGVFAIAAVVDHFSDAVVKNPIVGKKSKNPQLREWHTKNLERLPGLKFMRTLWVCNVSGGPYQFAATKPGKTPLGLEEAHRDLRISPAEFDEVAAELGRTLDFAKVPKSEKAEVLAAFAAHKDEVTAGYVAAAKRG